MLIYEILMCHLRACPPQLRCLRCSSYGPALKITVTAHSDFQQFLALWNQLPIPMIRQLKISCRELVIHRERLENLYVRIAQNIKVAIYYEGKFFNDIDVTESMIFLKGSCFIELCTISYMQVKTYSILTFECIYFDVWGLCRVMQIKLRFESCYKNFQNSRVVRYTLLTHGLWLPSDYVTV